jgi:zinc transporter 1/2/3
MADAEINCSNARLEPFEDGIGLRVGAIFILLVSSGAMTLFPIVTRRVARFAVPAAVFDFAKFFGSGVIIATAFIHLLAPGVEALSSPCLNENFQNYPFAFAFAMITML